MFCRNTTLNSCLEAPNVQMALDSLESRWTRRRAGVSAASGGAAEPAATASDSAPSNPVLSPAPEVPTDTSGAAQGPAQAAAEPATAYSSHGTETQVRDGELAM